MSWSRRRFLRVSFNTGVYVSLLLTPIAFAVLVYAVFTSYTRMAFPAKEEATVAMTKVNRPIEVDLLIPGVTLPINELGFYVSALLICTVLHELGHAMASYAEDVPLNGFGMRTIFILPMAYADLPTDALSRIKHWRKLRIFCAGIWHNLLLGLLSYAIFSALPPLLSPVFSTSSGVYIMGLEAESPLQGPRGLQPSDVIVRINRVPVTNADSYHKALLQSLRDKPKYCISSEVSESLTDPPIQPYDNVPFFQFVHAHDESTAITETVNGVIECCDKSASDQLCFEHFIVNGILEMPPFMCLHIRSVIESADGYCDEQDNCNPGFYCIKPLLDNRTTIMQIKRTIGPEVLYLGRPGDVYQTAKWSEYVPKNTFWSPRVLEAGLLFLKYVTVFSFGLGFVNILPCYGFDGQYIVQIIVHAALAGLVRKRRTRETISLVVTVVGTLMLVLLVGDSLRHNLIPHR